MEQVGGARGEVVLIPDVPAALARPLAVRAEILKSSLALTRSSIADAQNRV